MISLIFPLALYLLGLLPAPFLKNRIPLTFFACTAFAWGALLWVVSAIVILWLPIAYTPAAMAIMIAVVAAAAGLRFRRHVQAPTPGEWQLLLAGFLSFLLIIATITLFNLANASPDSLVQLLFAGELGRGTITPLTLQEFGYWGPALAMLHSTAVWFGMGYIPGVQAAFVVTLLAGFFYAAFRGLSGLRQPPSRPLLVAILATFILGTNPFLLDLFFYIHNNVIAATYLLLGVTCLWLAQLETSPSFLWVGVAALLGLSLSRTETVIFAILFLALALSMTTVSYRVWALALLPFTVLLLGWNSWLVLFVQPTTHILTSSRVLLIVATLSAFYMLVLLANVNKWVGATVIPRLHLLIFLCLALMLGAMLILNSQPLLHSASTFLRNLFSPGWSWWGIIWWIVILGMLGLYWTPAVPAERLLAGGMLGFVMSLLAVSYFHPFRVGWGDSANRSFFHLLPLAIFYVTLRWGPYLLPDRSITP